MSSKELTREAFVLNSGMKNVSFDYDAMGNRIAKHVFDDNWMLEKSTYYILDAQGNCVNVYEHEVDAQDVLFSLKERHIYGSSTLGIYDDSVNMYTTTPSNLLSTTLGKKFYQMSDHRGNVNTVISDIKTPISTGTTVDYYEAYIVNIADYSGFGVELDGRTMKSEFYRRGFQNQEIDSEIKGEGNSVNYKYRMHDPRVGRFFAVDPLEAKYPHNSPYAFSENNLIHAIEFEGLEKTTHDRWIESKTSEQSVVTNKELESARRKGSTDAVDVITDFTPIVGQIKSAIISTTGYNPIQMEYVSDLDRSFAVGGLVFGGLRYGGKLKKAMKVPSTGDPEKTGEVLENITSTITTAKTFKEKKDQLVTEQSKVSPKDNTQKVEGNTLIKEENVFYNYVGVTSKEALEEAQQNGSNIKTVGQTKSMFKESKEQVYNLGDF